TRATRMESSMPTPDAASVVSGTELWALGRGRTLPLPNSTGCIAATEPDERLPEEPFMARSLFRTMLALYLSCGVLSAQEPGPATPPVVADGGAALIVASSRSGKTLYGYSVHTGAWEGVAVDNRDHAPLEPVVGSGVAYAVVGKKVYAFSAAKGRWDAVELPEVPHPRMTVGDRI